MDHLRILLNFTDQDLYEALDGALPRDVCGVIAKYKRIAEIPMLTLMITAGVAVLLSLESTKKHLI